MSKTHREKESAHSRRHFVVAAGACVGSAMLPACGKTPGYDARIVKGRVQVPRADFEALAGKKGGIWVFVQGMSYPIILVKTTEGLAALTARCTHQACRVKPLPTKLACTCHNSSFRFDGSPRGGPAQQPLETYPVESNDDLIEIVLG